MKARLIEATLECLEAEGYLHVTISGVAERAGVTRGALEHHFHSKEALILSAAHTLINNIPAQLESHMQALARSGQCFNNMTLYSCLQILGRREQRVLTDLLMASRHNPALAEHLRPLWRSAGDMIGAVLSQYFLPLQDHASVRELALLTQWILRGMAEAMQIGIAPPKHEQCLGQWGRLMAPYLRSRQGSCNAVVPPHRPSPATRGGQP
jgi:AcrR family transcriptional regulator